MGAEKDLCPTYNSGGAAPATPQQEEELRSGTNGVAARSLAARFASIDVARPSAVKKPGSDNGEPSALQRAAQLREEASTSGNGVNEAVWACVDRDVDEPILQDNDERFCLLPVK